MSDLNGRITAVQLSELVKLSAQGGADLDIDALLFSSETAARAIHAYKSGDCAHALRVLNEERRVRLTTTA